MTDEKELLRQLTKIANKESYVLLPRAYYERLFNGFDKLKRDIVRAREARDKYKEELKACMSREASCGVKE